MKIVAIASLIVAAFVAGWYAQPYFSGMTNGHVGAMAHSSVKPVAGDADKSSPLYWVAPMDPNYRRDKPGKSPMGMDLVPVYEEAGGQQNDGGVTITPTMEHNLGVRTAIVEEGPFDLPVKAVGTIAFNEDHLIHIHSRVEGWIEKTYVNSVGEAVEKGQKLFELYSPQLVNAQEEYLAALRSNNNMLLQASHSRLVSLGLNDSQISRLVQRKSVSQRITHYAEQGGVVASLGVREGMFIKPAVEIMSIGALDEVWLIAEVFERQAGLIKVGQKAEVSVPALPGKTRTGSVDYIYPVLDQQSRTLQVRLRFPNEDGLLKPNMFADVELFTSVGEKVIFIPREAVIRSGSHSRVVLAEGNGRFRPAFVVAGVEAGNTVQILEGLDAGQEVVVSAQFLLDSESNIEVALAALEEQKQSLAMPQQVFASGRIDSIRSTQGMLTITHDPIEEWQWPTMKMDFNLSAAVDISALSEGQQIEFTITKQGQWDYLVTEVTAVFDAAKATRSGPAAATKSVQTQGEIKEIMTDARMLAIVHDPIPEWQWPVMSMIFSVAEQQSIAELKVGQRVAFKLSETEDGDYLVEDIEPLN